ncbi:hypothetical protein ACOYR1_15985 [Thalassotalea piscium]
MKRRDILTRKFILDNIKINETVSAYPLRKVTSKTAKVLVNKPQSFEEKASVISHSNSEFLVKS